MLGKSPVPKKSLAGLLLRSGSPAQPEPSQVKKRKKRGGRKQRSSNIELAERRKLVIKFRLKGKTLREIAKELNTGYMTVKRDLDIVKHEVHEKVSQFDREYALGKSISVYEQIESEAWEQYFGCAVGAPGRVQFLNLVRTARNDQVKLLTDVGLINKAPAQVHHQFEANQVLKGWTDDARRIVALAIIRSQMDQADGKDIPKTLLEAQAGGNGHGKVIDVPDATPEPVEAPTKPEEPSDN